MIYNEKMKALRFLVAVVFCTMSVISIKAQTTMDDMQYLTINENVTTVITASEPVRFVDISTRVGRCHYRYGTLSYPVCPYLYIQDG